MPETAAVAASGFSRPDVLDAETSILVSLSTSRDDLRELVAMKYESAR